MCISTWAQPVKNFKTNWPKRNWQSHYPYGQGRREMTKVFLKSEHECLWTNTDQCEHRWATGFLLLGVGVGDVTAWACSSRDFLPRLVTPPPVLYLINMLKLQGPGGGRIKRTPPDPGFIAVHVYTCPCVSFPHHPDIYSKSLTI